MRDDQYVPRADAARPVLHFTGRADMEATLDDLCQPVISSNLLWAFRSIDTSADAVLRRESLTRTLRTGAAP